MYTLFFPEFFVKNYKPQVRLQRDKVNNKEYHSLAFTTMQLPCFNYYRHIFYSARIKIVPLNIYQLLTPIGLAFWIMDDGSRQGSGLHISVYGFSNEDVALLCHYL